MATEKRLIDVNPVIEYFSGGEAVKSIAECIHHETFVRVLKNAPIVDAVEVPDKELLKAIKLLIKQYERSKQSGYVHSPVAHALFHTWKQVDERRTDNA